MLRDEKNIALTALLILGVIAMAIFAFRRFERSQPDAKKISKENSFETDTTSPKHREPRLLEVGKTHAICPYCDCALNKMPGRKKKRPHCGQYMYVRTRPLDRKEILVKEAEIELIKEQWAIAHGTYDEYIVERQTYDQEKAELTQRFGHEPSKADIIWSQLNKQLAIYALKRDWGLYRNTRLQMARVLRKESRMRPALSTYLEVCYLDLNGPRNLGGMMDPEILREYPAFSRHESFIASGVVEEVVNLMKKLDLGVNHVESIFKDVASKQHSNLQLPVNPQEAWNSLSQNLLSRSQDPHKACR